MYLFVHALSKSKLAYIRSVILRIVSRYIGFFLSKYILVDSIIPIILHAI